MLIDTLVLAEGSTAINLTVTSGSDFPMIAPSVGELFYKTGVSEGLYVFSGSSWSQVGNGGSGVVEWTDIQNKPTTVSSFGILDAYSKTEVDSKIAAGQGLDLVRYLSQPGQLAVFTGKSRWYPPQNINILWIEASIDTPATGSNISLVLKKNGSIIAGSATTINAGANKSNRNTLSNVSATDTDYFTLDVTQVGSTTPGSDLVVAISYEYQ